VAKFRFRLESLQKYRENERDLCRQSLAQALAVEAELAEQHADVEREREATLAELRDLNDGDKLVIDRAAARRYHAGQLAYRLRQLDLQRQQAAVLVAQCRQVLVQADQGVKVLEKLSEKQQMEFEAELERHAAREREDNWQAARLRESWS
jgi:flagellar biosynthesis chaperone FliJ